jgi:hypothetical protein
MSTFPSDLYAFVTGDATIAALVGHRLYPNVIPEAQVWAGCTMVYKTITNQREQSHDGSSALSQTGIQFDCYSRTRAETKTVMDALAALFLGYKGRIGPGQTPVGAIIFGHESDGYETETRLFRATAEYEFFNQT